MEKLNGTLLDLPTDIVDRVKNIAVYYKVSGESPLPYDEMKKLFDRIGQHLRMRRHVRPSPDDAVSLETTTINKPTIIYNKERPIQYKFLLGITPERPPPRRLVRIEDWKTLEKLSVVPFKHLFRDHYERRDVNAFTKFYHDMFFIMSNYDEIVRQNTYRNESLHKLIRPVCPEDIRRAGNPQDDDEGYEFEDRVRLGPGGWLTVLAALHEAHKNPTFDGTTIRLFQNVEGKRKANIVFDYKENGDVIVNIQIKKEE